MDMAMTFFNINTTVKNGGVEVCFHCKNCEDWFCIYVRCIPIHIHPARLLILSRPAYAASSFSLVYYIIGQS